MLEFARGELKREQKQMEEMELLRRKYEGRMIWGLLLLLIGVGLLYISWVVDGGTILLGLTFSGVGGWWILRWFINSDCKLAFFLSQMFHWKTIPIRKLESMKKVIEINHRIDWLKDREAWQKGVSRKEDSEESMYHIGKLQK